MESCVFWDQHDLFLLLHACAEEETREAKKLS